MFRIRKAVSLRMLFSTRALEVLNTCVQVEKKSVAFSTQKATLFESKKRRFFFALFRTTRKVCPNVFEYQCVAMAIFAREIWPKITAFSALSPARVLRNIDFPKHRKSSKIKNRQKEHYYTCRVQYEILS